MWIRPHTHYSDCSVESVTERGAAVPSLSSVSERVGQVVKHFNACVLSRAARFRDTFTMVLKHSVSKPPLSPLINI